MATVWVVIMIRLVSLIDLYKNPQSFIFQSDSVTPGSNPPPKPPLIFTVPENATTTTITNAPKDDEVEKEEFYQNDEIEEDLFSDLETNDDKAKH